jgi:pimeloyl-ACP methyl ester carboxylesterase
MSAALDTIQWTEALAAAHVVSPPEFLIALGLLSFAGLANLLASLLHSAADAAPLDYTIVRTPLDRFEPARSLGFNFRGHFLQPDGHPRIHYLDEGRPDASYALLLLHGEPFWSQAWQKVVPPLAREARVVVPDMVGFGLSDKWVDWRQYSLARHADSLLQLVDRLGLGRPPGQQVVLVGHNWGWMVGAEMARQRPDLFSRLVILNTNNLPDGEAALGRYRSLLWTGLDPCQVLLYGHVGPVPGAERLVPRLPRRHGPAEDPLPPQAPHALPQRQVHQGRGGGSALHCNTMQSNALPYNALHCTALH